MKFYLQKNADISRYGFIKQNDRFWFWYRTTKYGRNNVNLIYYEKDRRITISSASSDSIAVLCEMYKNGDIIYMEEDKLVNVSLTQEEYDMIMEKRNNGT